MNLTTTKAAITSSYGKLFYYYKQTVPNKCAKIIASTFYRKTVITIKKFDRQKDGQKLLRILDI